LNAWLERYDSHQPCTTDKAALFIENHIRATTLFRKLGAHSFWRQNCPTTKTACSGAGNGAFRDFLVAFWMEYLERYLPAETQGAQSNLSICFLAKPERAHKWNLGSAFRRFAIYCSRPYVSDRSSPVWVFRIELGQFLLGPILDFATHPAKFLGQFRPVAGYVFQHDL